MGRMKPTTWEGGRIRYDQLGIASYDIRKIVKTQTGSVRVEFYTGCRRIEDAYKVLRKFEEDPTYRPGCEVITVLPSAVFMSDEMVESFLEWSARPKSEGGKANDKVWVSNKRLYLKWWQVWLAGKDLRKIPTSYLAEYLDGDPTKGTAPAKSRAHRIAVIKHFYGWLRKTKHLVKHTEDPTIDLQKPLTSPAQQKKRKSHTKEEVAALRPHLFGVWLDAFDVDMATGWHARELFRFAHEGGFIEAYSGPDADKFKVLVSPRGKDGGAIRTAVPKHIAEAAWRLMETDNPSVETRRDLYEKVWARPISVVAKEFGHSDVTLAKTCHDFGIPTPPRGYWQKLGAGQKVGKEIFFSDYTPKKNRRHTFNPKGYARALKEASKAAGVPEFFPGEGRHTVATHAVNEGADLAKVSTFLNHKSPSTTKRFYATLAVPGSVPTPADKVH